MIKLTLAIPNQWSRDETNYKSIFVYAKEISKNKRFRLEYYRATVVNLFSIHVDLRWRGQSHIGPDLHIEINGYMLRLSIIDNRPWNYTEGRWEKV